MTTFDAVLFDMDGLLIDSEPLWFEAEAATARWLGGPEWTREEWADCIGWHLSRVADRMLGRSRSDQGRQAVEDRILAEMLDLLRHDVPLRPGALELAQAVAAADLPRALVSSSYRAMLDVVLDRLGRELFPESVAGDEVTNRKPHPEPYLTAARRLGVRPARCLVLEDSPTGIAAAEAAGCRVIAVPDAVEIPSAPGRVVVPTLERLDLAGLRRLLRTAA